MPTWWKLDTSSASALAASLKAPARQVSIDNAIGGLFWRRDGRELVFMSQPPKPLIMAADVTTDSLGYRVGNTACSCSRCRPASAARRN